MTEEDIRGLFREMREDSVPADSMARVRMRITERTAAWRRWKLAVWVMAPLCLLVLAVTLWSPARIALPPVEPVRIEQAVMRPEPPAQVVRRKQVARRRPQRPVLIRIETPDPEVVILLVGN
jgi:hypothetical protein